MQFPVLLLRPFELKDDCMGFPIKAITDILDGGSKIRGTIWGVPIIRVIVYWGLYRGLLDYGIYQMSYEPIQCPVMQIQQGLNMI